jgi:hypothetical protein
VRGWSVTTAVVACGVAVTAAYVTPPVGATAAAALAGWPRLVLYALAGALLAVSAPASCVTLPVQPQRAARGAYPLLGLGVAASSGVAAVCAVRLSRSIDDPLGPPLWLLSMLLLLGYSLFPRVRRLGWLARWPVSRPAAVDAVKEAQRWRWLGPALLLALLVIAAALRLPALGAIPQGINADEGDRAASAFDVLGGQAPTAWFDSGWFYISMVYFRLLAASMLVFGADVAGGRMLNALVGIGFVGAIAWIGVRNFGWRIGLLATSLAAGLGITLQHSRFIAETGPTALLWALSIGGFLEGARTGRPWAWAVAGLCGGLSLYFYPSARLWAVGAALTAIVVWLHQRDRRLWLGCCVAAVGALVAAAPFVIHLSQHPDETAGRYLQTAVLDPRNQARLAYLTPPEPLPTLAALQVERTLGLFDRYPDGGGLYPTGRPLFPPPLAAVTLLGAAYVLVRSIWDVRLAVLSVWFWLGLSGVALTVETPDYLRAVGMLPSLCFLIAVPLVDIVDRLLGATDVTLVRALARRVVSVAVPAVLGLTLVTPEIAVYFTTFRTLPAVWGPLTREGQLVAALAASGPVYSLEMDEHLVNSGWVRLLAPTAERGRLPNPGRELPVLAPAGRPEDASDFRPGFIPAVGQGLSLVLADDVNQDTYLDLLGRLYPLGTATGEADRRRVFELSPAGLAAVRGAMLVSQSGATRPVQKLGEIPADVALPAELTWRAGIRLARPGRYRLAAVTPGRASIRLDGVALADQASSTAAPLLADVVAAPGLHFLELVAEVTTPDQPVALTVDDPGAGPRELTASEMYRPMDAPWGLLARLARPSPAPRDLVDPSAAFLDATVSMAFFVPELGSVSPPNSIVWTGTLVAPFAGAYRMAFAAEDAMRLELDGHPADVVTVGPDQWSKVGLGSVVQLSAGPHPVRVTLDVTHAGRELARWNWVPPRPGGTPDAAAAWTVVPPMVLRPDPPIAVVRRPTLP